MAMQNSAAAVVETAPDVSGTYGVSVESFVEEGVRYYSAESDDISGLVLEAKSLEQMVEYMLEVIPVLLELNHGSDKIEQDRVSIERIGAANPSGLTKYQVIISP